MWIVFPTHTPLLHTPPAYYKQTIHQHLKPKQKSGQEQEKGSSLKVIGQYLYLHFNDEITIWFSSKEWMELQLKG